MAEIFRDHFELVTSCVAHTLGPQYVAAQVEEVAGDALAEMHRSLDGYDPRFRIQGWIYTITFRTAAQRRRRDSRKRRAGHLVAPEHVGPDGLEGIADGAPNPEDLMAGHQMRKLLDTYIAALPERDRNVLNMRLSGLTEPEMAEVLDIPLGTVKSRVRRAEDALAEVAKRDRAAQRAKHGVTLLPLLMSDVMARVGADVQQVPGGMRERVAALLRARMAPAGAPVSAAPLLTAPALAGGAGAALVGLVVGLISLLVGLAALVILLLALRRPIPSSDAATGAPGSAPASAPAAPASLPAAPVTASPSSSPACSSPASPAPSDEAPPGAPAPAAADGKGAHGPSAKAQRRAIVMAFAAAIKRHDYTQACRLVGEYNAHQFLGAGADADRAEMAKADACQR